MVEHISVYLPPKEAQKLRAVAERLGLSISDVARLIILSSLDRIEKPSDLISLVAQVAQPKEGKEHKGA